MDNHFENPNPSEKFCSCRLLTDEINYIDKHWDGKFSEYVHHNIKKDITNLKQNNTTLFKETGLYVLLMGFGMFFFVLGMKSTMLLEMVLSYIIGMFMFTYGTVGGTLYALQSAKQRR